MSNTEIWDNLVEAYGFEATPLSDLDLILPEASVKLSYVTTEDQKIK